MNTVKFDKKTLEDIFKKIALGNSIKSVLDEMNLSYEGFRKTIRKSDKLKKLYDDAKEDGVELLLSESNKKLE